MHRGILTACLPCFLWMLGAFALLWLLLRISGGRLELAKLRSLHRCQEGGVQTLSFVLTLPVFMMIVLFIIQISQLMIGITVVHYAAVAAARAASVWLPSEMPAEPANQLAPAAIMNYYPTWTTPPLNYYGTNGGGAPSWKCQKIWQAAVLACIPISPSHQYLTSSASQQSASAMSNVTAALYQQFVSKTAGNPQIPIRIRNKTAYAGEHTWIMIAGADMSQNSLNGPTYNPLNHPPPTNVNSPEYMYPYQWQFKANEIGWQDAITVQVSHRFALLTGPGRLLSPGRFLSTKLAPGDGTPDKVSSSINIWDKSAHPGYAESVYYVVLSANATITNEGMKSIIPHYGLPESLQ